VTAITIDIDAPTTLPLDLDTVKNDLRISGNDLDTEIICQYIPDAVSWAEGCMRRSIISREHRWLLTDFPRTITQEIVLPRGKTQSITSIAYTSNGAVTTLTGATTSPQGTGYQEDLRGHAGRIMPNRNASWPSVDVDVPAPVVITFNAGWLTAALVPADIKRALTARIYEAMELNGLLMIRQGFDFEFTNKLISAWRVA